MAVAGCFIGALAGISPPLPSSHPLFQQMMALDHDLFQGFLAAL
jgi:hypothetical protein